MALSRFGYRCQQIEQGLALAIETAAGKVTLWLPESHPAHEYLWPGRDGGQHRVSARMVRDLGAVAGRIAGTIGPPPGGQQYPDHPRPIPLSAPSPRRKGCEDDCTVSVHDHDVYDRAGRRVAHARPICTVCLLGAHYNLTADCYEHDDPLTPGCVDGPLVRVIPKRQWSR